MLWGAKISTSYSFFSSGERRTGWQYADTAMNSWSCLCCAFCHIQSPIEGLIKADCTLCNPATVSRFHLHPKCCHSYCAVDLWQCCRSAFSKRNQQWCKANVFFRPLAWLVSYSTTWNRIGCFSLLCLFGCCCFPLKCFLSVAPRGWDKRREV